MQTFEMACRQMAREHNEEHQAAQESGGPLCARPSFSTPPDISAHFN